MNTPKSSTLMSNRWLDTCRDLWAKPVRKYLLWSMLAFAAIVTICVSWPYPEELKCHYEKLRGSLLTGFFTLSGFLLSAKTFLMLNMKKEMLSSKEYIKRVKRQEKLTPEGEIKIYQPIQNMAEVLLANIVLCLIASVAQFTLGVTECYYCITICIAAAGGAIAMFCFSLWILNKMTRDMCSFFEWQAREEINNPSPPKA